MYCMTLSGRAHCFLIRMVKDDGKIEFYIDILKSWPTLFTLELVDWFPYYADIQWPTPLLKMLSHCFITSLKQCDSTTKPRRESDSATNGRERVTKRATVFKCHIFSLSLSGPFVALSCVLSHRRSLVRFDAPCRPFYRALSLSHQRQCDITTQGRIQKFWKGWGTNLGKCIAE